MGLNRGALRILERLRQGPATNRELAQIGGMRVAARVHELRTALPWTTGETVLSVVHQPSHTCLYWLEVVGRAAIPRLAPARTVSPVPHKARLGAATRPLPPCGKILKNKDGEPSGECRDADGANCCKAGHIHNRSMRYVEKRLLRDLWRVWREEGQISRALQEAAALLPPGLRSL